MLRLPPTKIDLTRRDLDWHSRRSDYRINTKARIQDQRFVDFEVYRRDPVPVGTAEASTKNSSAAIKTAQTRSAEEPDAMSWEDTTIQSCSRPTGADSSPSLPVPRARAHQQDETESSESAAYDDEATSSESVNEYPYVPFTAVSNNIQQPQDVLVAALSERLSSASTQVDGSSEIDENGDETHNHDFQSPGVATPRTFHATPSASSNPWGLVAGLPMVLPARLRTTSGNAPHFGSPLRFIEAVPPSSSPERPTEAALAQLQSMFEQAQGTSDEDSHNGPETLADLPSTFQNEDDVSVSINGQSPELSSPATDDDLRRFRIEPEATPSRSRDVNHSSLLPVSSETVRRNTNVSVRFETNNAAISNNEVATAVDTEAAMEFGDALDGMHDGTTPIVPQLRVPVYNDQRPRFAQPQTPVGLPRNGIPAMSLDDAFTTPTRRPRRLPNAGSPRLVGFHNGHPIFYRQLEGHDQQENVNDLEMFRLQQESTRQQEETSRSTANNVLETTPPSRRGRYQPSRGRG